MIVRYPNATWVAGNDAGNYTTGPYRIVLHTTEGGSAAGAFAAYKNANSWPHFTCSSSAVYQHINIDRAARSLMHPAHTVETNRLSCVQIEMVGFAASPPRPWPHLIELVRWIATQTGVRLDHQAALKPYPASYGPNNGLRFTDTQWQSFDGICGHQNVPHNDHGDPGAFDLTAFASTPASHPINQTGSVEVDMQVATVDVTIDTDHEGNGWQKVPYPVDHIIGHLGPGLRPAADGHYGGAEVGFAPENNGTIISVTDWFANSQAVVRIRVAA